MRRASSADGARGSSEDKHLNLVYELVHAVHPLTRVLTSHAPPQAGSSSSSRRNFGAAARRAPLAQVERRASATIGGAGEVTRRRSLDLVDVDLVGRQEAGARTSHSSRTSTGGRDQSTKPFRHQAVRARNSRAASSNSAAYARRGRTKRAPGDRAALLEGVSPAALRREVRVIAGLERNEGAAHADDRRNSPASLSPVAPSGMEGSRAGSRPHTSSRLTAGAAPPPRVTHGLGATARPAARSAAEL